MRKPEEQQTMDLEEALADMRLAAIVDSSFDAIIGKDLSSIITDWNAAAERLFGYTAEEAIGRSILMLMPESRRSEEAEIISRITRGERVETFETVRVRKDGRLVDVSLTISPIRDRSGRIVGASKIARDISAAKESERRIALLLREVHHRVKNNLQTVASLVQLQPMPSDVKRELHSRIMAIAAVHEHLHREENFDDLDLGSYLRGISEAVNASYGDAVRLEFEFDGVEVGPDTATTLGLIVNELITNTNKYAFADRRPGRFGARLTKGEGRAELSIYNDGIPFNAGAKADGIGIRLIRSLASSLDPHYTLDGANGLDFRISFATAE